MLKRLGGSGEQRNIRGQEEGKGNNNAENGESLEKGEKKGGVHPWRI